MPTRLSQEGFRAMWTKRDIFHVKKTLKADCRRSSKKFVDFVVSNALSEFNTFYSQPGRFSWEANTTYVGGKIEMVLNNGIMVKF